MLAATRGNYQAQSIDSRIVNARRHAELHQAVLDTAHDAQARAQPVALHRLQPHAAHGSTDRVVPDPAALVDAGLLLATRNLGVERVGNTDRQPVKRPETMPRQLVAEGG